ncbi:glycosyltransferase family 2 protein [Methanobacterium oryzae]|uniref:glycosyltransferase family 2 protein n=1 Tax=Methanobacterium oryzae TaxID=69540 RepID=UPI003D216695
MKDTTFLIPAYNEEKSIGTLLNDIKLTYPKSKIIVIDNNSNDNTAEIAKRAGVKLLYERKQGKGHAIRKGFQNVKTKFAVMLDADNTYYPKDAQKLLFQMKIDDADVVLGSRLNGKREDGSITKLNLFGNHILSLIASLLFCKVSDVCTGYWAFRKEVIDCILKEGINSSGFELEAELFIKIYNNDFKIIETPIGYGSRVDSPKLQSIADGFRIFRTLWAYRIGTQNNGNGKINKKEDLPSPNASYWNSK